MFEKLRNKFLLLNMITISVLMLVSFSIIYIIMLQNVNRDNADMLRRASMRPVAITRGQMDDEFIENRMGTGMGRTVIQERNGNRVIIRQNESAKEEQTEERPMRQGMSERIAQNNPAPLGQSDFSSSFTVHIDSEGSISSINSTFDIDEEICKNVAQTALSQQKKTSKINFDNTVWLYEKNSAPTGERLTFVEITKTQQMLVNLIYAFILIGILALGIIYIISVFFANKAIKPISEAFDKQKEFIADASHELKTPIATIGTNADVLLANMDDTVRNQSKWLLYIKSETDRMAKLINELLYLAKMDYTDNKIIYSDFDLSHTINDCILIMETIIYEKKINLNCSITPGIVLYGNQEQIKQLTMILLDNAIKYSNENGEIKITLTKYANNISFGVSNTGSYISKQDIEHIFDRFYRADKSRDRASGGYGLGLSIAQSVARAHGGKIKAASEPDGYTTFTVEL